MRKAVVVGDPGLPIMVGLLAVPVGVLLFVLSLAVMGRRWAPTVTADAGAGDPDLASDRPEPAGPDPYPPAYGSPGRAPYVPPATRPAAPPAARPAPALPPPGSSPRTPAAPAPRALPAAASAPPVPWQRPASPWEPYDAGPPRTAGTAGWDPYAPPVRPPREPSSRRVQEPPAPRPYRPREHHPYGPADPYAQAAAARRRYGTADGQAGAETEERSRRRTDGREYRGGPPRGFPYGSYDPSDPHGEGST